MLVVFILSGDSPVPEFWKEFFYMVYRISDELAEKPCQVLGELVGRSANVVNSGSRREPPPCVPWEIHIVSGIWSRPDAVFRKHFL